jgi:hypothetical protein
MKTEYQKGLYTTPAIVNRWTTKVCAGLVIIVLLVTSSTVFAHHSWGAIYNEGEPVSITAVITSTPYRNPHDRVDATITNEAGETEEWKIEWRGRRGAGGRGRGEDGRGRQVVEYDLNIGDEVTIEGVTARDPNRLTIQMTKLTRISDGMTIEASLGRERNGADRGEGRREGRGNRRNQVVN